MPHATHLAAISALSLTVLAAGARDVSAQTLPMLKVVSESATIRVRPALLSDVVKKVDAGTMLEAVDREDDWYWVILAVDEHGTRYPGWVRAHDVEVVAAGEPRSVLRHFVEAVEQAKARLDTQAAEDEARLERARLKVEEARQQYDALTNNAPAPAPDQKSPAATQSAPVRIPRADQPHPEVSREYEWFGGYSFYRDQSDSMSFPGGWAFSVARQLTPEIDIVGGISGSHKSDDLLGVNIASTKMYTFAAGPKYARRTGNVTSFGQVLVGLATIRTSAFGVSDSSTGFALQPGFGVDIPIRKPLALRAGFDVETVHTSGGWFTGFRISTGLLLISGGAK